MAAPVSTSRIRITKVWYAMVLVLATISERPAGAGVAGELMSTAGLALIMLATLGRIWVTAHICGLKDTRLVTFGPYSVCRHPLYALSLMAGLGLGLSTRSLIITAITLALLAWLHLRAIRTEERFLLSRHGETFEHYRRQVPRLWPAWGSMKIATEATLDLRIFFKAFLDAGTLMALYVLIRLLDIGREAGWWPALFNLW